MSRRPLGSLLSFDLALAERDARFEQKYGHYDRPDVRKTFVYFLIDAGGTVLYVGRSVNPRVRWVNHVADQSKPWTDDVATFRKSGPYTHRTAERLEREQIRLLQPIGNTIYTARGECRA